MPQRGGRVDATGTSQIQSHEQHIADIAQQFGLKYVPALPGLSGDAAYRKLTGTCGAESWKARKKGAFAELFFTTTLDKVP